MSARAACRLDTLGFEHVYDYVSGESDWFARGLPREGERAAEPRAIDFAGREVVTCRLDDRMAAVRELVAGSGFSFALVVSGSGVLLGRLCEAALEDDPDAKAETTMEPGPSTVRADTRPARLRERLERRNLTSAVITDPDGRLLGVVRRDDLPVDA
jgi:CBS domain-containing protein